MKYKAVVFDYAGVVAGMPSYLFDLKVSEILGVSINEIKEVYYRHNHLHNLGKISWEELWKIILDDLKKPQLLTDILDFVSKPKTINKEVIILAKELKKKNYKVALLSNYSKAGAKRMRDEHHLDQLFDLMLISAETGLAKPHADAFENLINKLNVKASEIVFIDDAPKNIKAAQEMGITSILCNDVTILRQQLVDKGVLK